MAWVCDFGVLTCLGGFWLISWIWFGVSFCCGVCLCWIAVVLCCFAIVGLLL